MTTTCFPLEKQTTVTHATALFQAGRDSRI